MVSVCLENRIAVYSPHTSWDNTRNSIGDWLCDALPHKPSEIIAASKLADDVGAGRVAEVDSTVPITLANAMDRVKRHVGVENVHLGIGVHQALDYEIKTFAVCPGSGSSVLRGVKADLFITGACVWGFPLCAIQFYHFTPFILTKYDYSYSHRRNVTS